MAMYHCPVCDNLIDDDWNPMCEHPYAKQFASYKDEICCDECAQVLEYELKEALKEDHNEL